MNRFFDDYDPCFVICLLSNSLVSEAFGQLWPVYLLVSSTVTLSQCLANIMCISMAVCDELLFGIPHQAWYVVVLVVLCLALALVIPSFLPSYLLPRNQGLDAADHGISKDS